MLNVKAVEAIQKECLELGIKKNSDYSGKGDNIAITGLKGISVRLMDKVMRLHNLVMSEKDPEVVEESVRDTLMETVNYATYGVMLLDGTWEADVFERAKSPAREATVTLEGAEGSGVFPLANFEFDHGEPIKKTDSVPVIEAETFRVGDWEYCGPLQEIPGDACIRVPMDDGGSVFCRASHLKEMAEQEIPLSLTAVQMLPHVNSSERQSSNIIRHPYKRKNT